MVFDFAYEKFSSAETCIVANWLQGQDLPRQYWLERIADCRRKASEKELVQSGKMPEEMCVTLLFANELRRDIKGYPPQLKNRPYDELLMWALDEVDCYEIAEQLLVEIEASTPAKRVDKGNTPDAPGCERRAVNISSHFRRNRLTGSCLRCQPVVDSSALTPFPVDVFRAHTRSIPAMPHRDHLVAAWFALLPSAATDSAASASTPSRGLPGLSQLQVRLNLLRLSRTINGDPHT